MVASKVLLGNVLVTFWGSCFTGMHDEAVATMAALLRSNGAWLVQGKK